MHKVSPPPEPAWLAGHVEPEILRLRVGDILWRIYKTAGPHPQA